MFGHFCSENTLLNSSLCFYCSNGNTGLYYEYEWFRLKIYSYQHTLGHNDFRHHDMSSLVLEENGIGKKNRPFVVKLQTEQVKVLNELLSD